MLLAVTLPVIRFDLLRVFESVHKVVTVAEESVGFAPSLAAEATKHPSLSVLHDQQSVLNVSASLEHRDQTAAILLNTEDALPVTFTVKDRQSSNQITRLLQVQNP